ncbi:myoD family inhibitor domain-containing protein-like isoform X1 [Carassius auratus]|uniref:MyoD family inhibitor domain-containing protein-like isoform X1 n=1 Tax=Carassius auratus TaxID=7957 RepID=A0A6P6NKA4_CARAU|nr:myoD family inhibitor domain-containing protein-like isoform X1 [Carassius auratus]XP_026109018.1 myoD family inhibitor domain-containing protein-like isoform X1 [Carassius auratus]
METEALDVLQRDGGQGSAPDKFMPQESHVHTTQPQATHKPDVTGPVPAEIVDNGRNESLTDSVSTNDDALLLPDHIPTISRKIEKGNVKPSIPSGSAIIRSPPASSSGGSTPRPTTQQKCNGHAKCNGHRKHTPSTSKSQQRFKADASQIQKVAGDDCCAHCILACLFCEVLSWCSAMAQCLACGLECDALCCCGEAATGGLACCTEDTCSALLDCGIAEDCCQSSDCLEICVECCSICFTA